MSNLKSTTTKTLKILMAFTVIVFTALSLMGASSNNFKLAGGYLTDDADVISDEDAYRIQIEAGRLSASADIDLMFVFVESFDGEPSIVWADAVSVNNGLGDRDILLAVATEDREYAWSIPGNFSMTDEEFKRITQDSIEPLLAQENWGGAAIAGIKAFPGYPASNSDAAPGTKEFLDDNMTSAITNDILDSVRKTFMFAILVPLGFIAVIGIIVFVYFRSKKKKRAEKQEQSAQDSIQTQQTEVFAKLLDVDDAIRASLQEMGFAEAEFGTKAVEPYRAAIKDAQNLLGKGYDLQHQIEQAPQSEIEQRQALIDELSATLNQANDLLSQREQAFHDLRDLVNRLPQARKQVQELLETSEKNLAPSIDKLNSLKERYPNSALGDVADDDEEATDLLNFAKVSLSSADESIENGNKQEAALAVRAAENALNQVRGHFKAISKKAENLSVLENQIKLVIAELREEIPQVETSSYPDAKRAAAHARSQLEQAQQQVAQGGFDPSVVLDRLTEADKALDAILEADQLKKAHKQRFQTEFVRAQAAIDAAESYIATRPGAVQASARTRLANAESLLSQAQLTSAQDPETAAELAANARKQAESAQNSASRDVTSWQRQGPFGSGSSPAVPTANPWGVELEDLMRSRRGASRGGEILGDIAGSFIGALLAGAVDIPKSSGGTSRSGSSSSLFGSGGFSPRSFGGSRPSSGSSRRSIGGGGSRRSGGGKF